MSFCELVCLPSGVRGPVGFCAFLRFAVCWAEEIPGGLPLPISLPLSFTTDPFYRRGPLTLYVCIGISERVASGSTWQVSRPQPAAFPRLPCRVHDRQLSEDT